MPVRRFVVQNDGPWLLQVPVAGQFWSKGTSGQCAALAVFSLAALQSKDESGRHRSEVSKKTWPAAGAVVSYTLPARCPYWILAR
jgi:hypothetical protein